MSNKACHLTPLPKLVETFITIVTVKSNRNRPVPIRSHKSHKEKLYTRTRRWSQWVKPTQLIWSSIQTWVRHHSSTYSCRRHSVPKQILNQLELHTVQRHRAETAVQYVWPGSSKPTLYREGETVRLLVSVPSLAWCGGSRESLHQEWNWCGGGKLCAPNHHPDSLIKINTAFTTAGKGWRETLKLLIQVIY